MAESNAAIVAKAEQFVEKFRRSGSPLHEGLFDKLSTDKPGSSSIRAGQRRVMAARIAKRSGDVLVLPFDELPSSFSSVTYGPAGGDLGGRLRRNAGFASWLLRGETSGSAQFGIAVSNNLLCGWCNAKRWNGLRPRSWSWREVFRRLCGVRHGCTDSGIVKLVLHELGHIELHPRLRRLCARYPGSTVIVVSEEMDPLASPCTGREESEAWKFAGFVLGICFGDYAMNMRQQHNADDTAVRC